MTNMGVNPMDGGKRKKLIASTAFGGVSGFVVSFALMRAIGDGYLGDLDASRTIAALVGAIYLLCGGFVAIGLLNPVWGAKFLNVEDADELQEQAAVLRYSVVGVCALGASLLLLALAAPAGPLAAEVVGLLIAGLMAAMVYTSIRQFKATGFYLLFAIGGGWAALAHLGFVASPSPLDWITLFAAVMLGSAFWTTGRRGLLTPR